MSAQSISFPACMTASAKKSEFNLQIRTSQKKFLHRIMVFKVGSTEIRTYVFGELLKGLWESEEYIFITCKLILQKEDKSCNKTTPPHINTFKWIQVNLQDRTSSSLKTWSKRRLNTAQHLTQKLSSQLPAKASRISGKSDWFMNCHSHRDPWRCVTPTGVTPLSRYKPPDVNGYPPVATK